MKINAFCRLLIICTSDTLEDGVARGDIILASDGDAFVLTRIEFTTSSSCLDLGEEPLSNRESSPDSIELLLLQ